jgi:hypothetical protein
MLGWETDPVKYPGTQGCQPDSCGKAQEPESEAVGQFASETLFVAALHDKALAVMQVCSVSSEIIPRPKRNRYRSILGYIFFRLLRESPSKGNPRASPTAVPRMQPTIFRLMSEFAILFKWTIGVEVGFIGGGCFLKKWTL